MDILIQLLIEPSNPVVAAYHFKRFSDIMKLEKVSMKVKVAREVLLPSYFESEDDFEANEEESKQIPVSQPP